MTSFGPQPSPPALAPKQLTQACDPEQFSFQTTAELDGLSELIGQMRAMEAVRFGAGIRRQGYNVYVLGPAGMGKRSMVSQILASRVAQEREPEDWCYLNNFSQPHKPQAVSLPTGRGKELREQMVQVVDYLRSAIPALFESDEYRAKAQAIQEEFSKQQEDAFKSLGDDAVKQQIALLRTPGGFVFAPTRNQEVLQPGEYEKLPPQEKQQITAAIAELQERLEKILAHVPQWWKERSERLKQLNRETTLSVITHVMADIRARFSDLTAIQKYLDAVQQDMVENADDFRKEEESTELSGLTIVTRKTFHRYQVNVLVSNGKQAGSPVVSEDNPTYSNLIGRVEHVAQLGALVTDFTLIKPGALHRANGGYLLLDVRKVLMQPFAWDGLKRALQAREIRIESLGQMYSLVSTVSLEPEPISLDVKIVLFGDRLFYYLLQQLDPDFAELFKVAADFEDRIERSGDTHLLYARLMATLCAKDNLLPLDRSAVARVIEHSARLAGDAERLSTHMRSMADLLQESDYWAREDGTTVVVARHVQKAIDAQIRRQDRLRVQLHDAILRGTLLIDTQGSVVGQINGLSVLELGGFAFAQPTRITATSRLGEGEMINVEREVKLSGAIHSKGVLILASFLATRYARDQPLALSASLVFEQSYGQVEGDSASLAELCVLLSHLANTPVLQSLAVTGSVNQLGQVQAIGAVNEKIEGFFDICMARGLTGSQGVIIPSANVKHLMLRRDVIAAAEAGKFHVRAVDHVDQAIALLTSMPAGEVDARGHYPDKSVNQRVAVRIAELSALRKSFARHSEKKRKNRKY
ncbi:Lon protease family protein [Rhodoferax sp.]|uniref:Lon protease family protein n=1 Tax=Rhodoferax sp. TaxID=50421 RepID=UPI001EB59282|nr:ATP-binding protein [Rhodoferax sp.]MBT9505587.1 AAA family ATPase [Rhodoferax sp.]